MGWRPTGPLYGLEPEELEKPEGVFKRLAPLTVEIGFGKGDSLLEMAVANPQRNYLGIEVYRPGIGNLLINIHKEKLENLKVVNRDSIEVLGYLPPDWSRLSAGVFPGPLAEKKTSQTPADQLNVTGPRIVKTCPGGLPAYSNGLAGLCRANPFFAFSTSCVYRD